ncbi:MAG: sensor histidine kinase, partial [Clostridiales bacterium]|nr:sensor histidine kinase [Clostridiales bacterium]
YYVHLWQLCFHGKLFTLKIIKELKKTDELDLTPLGTLIINLDMSRLIAFATAQNKEYEDVSCFLFDGDRLLFNYSTFSDGEAQEIHRQLSHSYDVISLDSDRLFAVGGTIPLYGWSYICATSYRSIYRAITLSSQSFCVITVLTMLVVFVFVVRMISSLFSRFDRLIENMRQFGEGNYRIEPVPASYPADEIGLLYKNFDAMVEKIETLIEENYVNELLKKEAQIKALESQIDPHFLYNTLDSINWRARLIKSDEISQITTSLGTLLRISLSKDTEGFCLRQELTLVENYIVIQKIRYHDRLDCSIRIPEQYWSVPIPKFTLQPLLENAIRYGLEESSEICRISISGKCEAGVLILQVTNTGSSFEDNLLEKLENGSVLPHGFGIGVLNIHKRIQLTYGKQYGLRLYTLEDENTCEEYAVAEVRIPCPSEERKELC